MERIPDKKQSVKTTQNRASNVAIQGQAVGYRAQNSQIVSSNPKPLFEEYHVLDHTFFYSNIECYLSWKQIMFLRLVSTSFLACIFPVLQRHVKVCFNDNDDFLKNGDFELAKNEKKGPIICYNKKDFSEMVEKHKAIERVKKWEFASGHSIPIALSISNRTYYLSQEIYKPQLAKVNLLSIEKDDSETKSTIQSSLQGIAAIKNSSLTSLHLQHVGNMTMPMFPNLCELSIDTLEGNILLDVQNNLKTLKIMKLLVPITLGAEFSKLENFSILYELKTSLVIKTCALPNLQVLFIKENEKDQIELPESLPRLKQVSCNSDTLLMLPADLPSLTNLTIFPIPEESRVECCNQIKLYAKNLTSFSYSQFYDNSYEDSECELLALMKNLTQLHIGTIHGDSREPLLIENLTHFSIDNMSTEEGASILLLSNKMLNLRDIKIKTIPDKCCIQLPKKLNKLLSLQIGNISRKGILKIPDIFPEVENLVIQDVNTKIRFFSNKIKCKLIDCLNIFPNLKELTIHNIVNAESIKLTLPPSCQNLTINTITNTSLTLVSSSLINVNISNVCDKSATLYLSNSIKTLSVYFVEDEKSFTLSCDSIKIGTFNIGHLEGKLKISTLNFEIDELYIKGQRAKQNEPQSNIRSFSFNDKDYYIQTPLKVINEVFFRIDQTKKQQAIN